MKTKNIFVSENTVTSFPLMLNLPFLVALTSIPDLYLV